MAYDTYLLDQAVKQRPHRLERERKEILTSVLRFLDEFGPEYCVDRAIIFGSLVAPKRFHEGSDVDIAVENIEPAAFFNLMAALSLALGREVDLVDLTRCHFADRIRETGEEWTKKR